LKNNPQFIQQNLNDLCASIQHTIVEVLIDKLIEASRLTGIKEIAIAGGVSANSVVRTRLTETGSELGWNVYIPEFQYSTDNAAMIAMAGYFKYLKGQFADQHSVPYARSQM
jgi:N6-L-threonylcarbamoyladenine synthase